MIRLLRRMFGPKYVPPQDEVEALAVNDPVLLGDLPFTGEIATDTASIAIFDLAALSRRIDDECDWWADPKEELKELNDRNALIVGLGADGLYKLEIALEQPTEEAAYSLRAPGGTIFVGPGEGITGEGNQPDGSWDGGYLISVPPGDYRAAVRWQENVVRVVLAPSPPFENDASQGVRI